MVLYFTEQPDTRKKLSKELKNSVEWVQFDLLSDADLMKWCARTLKADGKQIEPAAVEQLTFMAGRSLTTLTQELGKLSAYIGGRVLITPEDVEKVVTPSTECTVFQMIDCVLRRQSAQAQMLLKNMLENGESRIGALAMLTRQLRMLTHIRLMRSQGMTLQEIERKLSLNHYAASRAARQAGQFTVESLEEGYRLCVETDYAIKSGRMRDAAALDMLMLQLSNMK
jgi:DNA polymerase-3 subunit delta